MGFRKLLSKLILGEYFKESFFFFFFPAVVPLPHSVYLKWYTNCHSIQGKLFHKNYDEVLIFGNFGEFFTFGNFAEFFFFFLKFSFIFKLYNIVLVLPYIEMNPPQAYMRSPS